jgi:hypothetical protein
MVRVLAIAVLAVEREREVTYFSRERIEWVSSELVLMGRRSPDA